MKIKLFETKISAKPIKQAPQTAKVLSKLAYGPATTDKLENLGIRSPSSVIHRLRKQGWIIRTRLIWKKTAKYSWIIRQAEYTLLPNNAVEGDK